MAALGRREVTDRESSFHPNLPASSGVSLAGNLSVISTTVQPSVTLATNPLLFGSPIMGEDFITTTGFKSPTIG
jgi:hypothetical protein